MVKRLRRLIIKRSDLELARVGTKTAFIKAPQLSKKKTAMFVLSTLLLDFNTNGACNHNLRAITKNTRSRVEDSQASNSVGFQDAGTKISSQNGRLLYAIFF